MIRSENARVSFLDANGQTLKLVNLYGSSTDTKPTESLASGSTFVEVDTGKLFLFNEAASTWLEIGSGGGDNPNSVQVITGTLAEPFGDVNLTELSSAVDSSNASFIMELDLSILGISDTTEIASNPVQLVSPYVVGLQFRINDDGELANAIYVNWNPSNKELHSAWANYGGTITDMSEYASQIPTTLTIYWHPMPEGE